MDNIATILPIYINDNSNYLTLSIDSLLNQSYKNMHVYIGIDGPIGEDLKECINQYDKDERITIVWFKENRGLACVLNDLLDLAIKDGYEYIARMDADDISLPDRLEKQIVYLKNNPDIDVVGGAIEEINEKGESRNKVIVYPSGPDACWSFFSKRNPHAHPAVLFRKRFFEKAGCKYRPEYRQNQDTMLWYDGMKNGTLHANIPDVVLKFRMTDALFKKRRNGWEFAKKQFKDRIMINRGLSYGIGADIYGFAMFCLLISPAWIKKIAYRVFR